MTMKELRTMSDEELRELSFHCACRDDLRTCKIIADVIKFYHKTVKVVKGRKVPIGTSGECFWMGMTDYSKYGDPWGIYTKVRVGLRDKDDNVYWTSVDNIELA